MKRYSLGPHRGHPPTCAHLTTVIALLPLLAAGNAYAASPGGISSGLTAWVKADAGINSSEGGAVSTWADQSNNAYHLTQATSTAQPLYYGNTASKLLNFNPVLVFDGSNDFLRNANTLMSSDSAYTYLAVGTDEDTGTGYRKLFGAEYYVDYFGLYKQGGATGDNGWIPYAVGGQSHSAPYIGDRGSMGKGTKYSAAGGANGYWNGTNFTRDNRTDNIQPQIVGYMSQNSATTDRFFTWTDGYKDDPNWSPIKDGLIYRNQFHKQLALGADVHFDGANYEHWQGRIPEFLVYNRQLTDAEMAQVNTYLAIKYGVTLGQGNGSVGNNGNAYNYVASDASVVWDATANNAYAYNITAIGRDDASALNQKQSQSVNTGFQPVIGLGDIATSNSTNTQTFTADKSFLAWGSNNDAATFGTAYAPTSYTPPSGYFRLSRVWKVQETGSVGTVKIKGPGNANLLLVDNDGDYTNGGTTEVPLVGGIGTVDFSSGQYFTFGAEATAPGGVAANLGLWLKADAGTSTTTEGADVTAWNDQSLVQNDVSQSVAARQPNFVSNGMNFNPAIDFANGQVLSAINAGNKTIPNQTDPVTMVSVSTNRQTAGGYKTLISFSGALDYPSMHWYNKEANIYIDSVTTLHMSHSTTVEINTPTIMHSRANNADPKNVRLGYNGLSNIQTFAGADGSFPASSGTNLLSIGGETDAAGEPLDGLMTESIVYNRDLTDVEMQRVNSYLAVKYGITQSDTYLASDGTTKVWDKSANSTYHNNVAGIGRDDASALNQKQSKSVNSGFQPAIGLNSIAATNASNSSSFADNRSFLVWGSDTGTTDFNTTYTPNSYTPASGFYRMARVWKVQETGTVNNVAIQGPTKANLLLVDDDGDFTNGGTTEIALTDGLGSVNFSSGQYFTFGSELIAPGGVTNALSLWTKADKAGCSAGSTCSAWLDYSPNNNDVEAVGTRTLKAADANHNYQPFFDDFSSTSFFKDMSSSLAAESVFTAKETTVFAAVRPNASGTGRIVGIDNDDNFSAEPGLSIDTGKPNYYRYWNGTYNRTSTDAATPNQSAIFDYRTNGTELKVGLSGKDYSSTVTAGSGMWGDILTIGYGTWNVNGAFPGDIQEVVWYNTNLTDIQRRQVQSYLALKYGISLSQATAQDYLASDGTTKMWNANTAGSYNQNIAGIGRDDASGLNQKQSKSANVGSILAMGLHEIANSNAENSITFTTNKSFLTWADNGLSATTTVALNTTSCAAPGVADKRIEKIWQVQETSSVGSVEIMVDSLPFNTSYATYMLVSTDATFATYDAVPMTATVDGKFVVDYDFPANTALYITFAGNTSLPNNVCTSGDKSINWLDEGWAWGTNTKSITKDDMTFDFSITAGGDDVWLGKSGNLGWQQGDWYPARHWNGIWIPRWSTQTQAAKPITFTMTMNKPAMGISMEVCDVDAYLNRDHLTINGKLNGTTVAPKLSLAKSPVFSNLGWTATLPSTNEARGGPMIWDCLNPGRVFIDFDRPVDTVTIDYTLDVTHNLSNLFNDIQVKGIDVQCANTTAPKPTADNLYIRKRVAGGNKYVGDQFTYKFELENLSCAAKTIDLNDTLPDGLTWVDDSFSTSLATANTNDYKNGKAFSTTVTVPPGKSFVMLDAKAAATGTYNNQAAFAINGNTYLSDDPAQPGYADATPVVISNQPYPDAKVSLAMSVDKATVLQNGTFTYTMTFNNTEASAVKVNLQTTAWAGSSFVANSLANALGGTLVGDYATENNLQIMGITVPVGTSSITIQGNSNSLAAGTELVTHAEITPEDSPTAFMPRPVNSNDTKVTVVAASCGNSTVESGEFCDDGNTTAGDGCSNSCAIESGYICQTNANGDAVCDTGGTGSVIVDPNADTDGDGLTNAQEQTLGTDPTKADTDGDGKNDKTEVGANLASPTDTDGDGKIDALESVILDSDNDGTVDELDADLQDTDGDGLTDTDEGLLGTDPTKADTDGDGEDDKTEIGGNIYSPKDTDGDGKNDAIESDDLDADNDGVVNELDADDTSINNDTDGDGLDNISEKTLGTDPLKTDTDGDGEDDKTEVGSNLQQPQDTDGDGKHDAIESDDLDADNDGIVNELDANDNAANTAPTINAATSVSYAENGTNAVLDVNATDDTDSEGAGLTYQLDGSVVSDNAAFAIDSATGVLTFKTSPNYEAPTDMNKDNAYIVFVKACDSSNLCSTHVVVVTVTSVEEKVLEYSIRRDAGSNRYRVFMRPQTTPVTNQSLTGQITLKVPHTAGADQFAVNNLTSTVGGVTWAQNSRSNAPSEDSNADYLSFTFQTNPSNAFNWQAGQEIEVFNFTNDKACTGQVAVMSNSDAFNTLPNSVNSNPANQFNNMGWGPASENHYLGNYGTPQDCTLSSGLKLQVRVFLQGAYSSVSGLMHNQLATVGVLPDNQPYTNTPWVYNGTETLSSTVKAFTGQDAVTDWVLVELRNALLPVTVVATKAAIVQRDGDIVDADTGDATLNFGNLSAGNYYVTVRHRNHLAVMSALPVALSNDATLVDFTVPATSVFGTYARMDGANVSLMWAGDANTNDSVIANGIGNDPNLILSTLLMYSANTEANVNYRLKTYSDADINMDGYTIYAGPNNDINPLLGNVLLHPSNTNFAANFIIWGNLPK